jgi:hypothetical protein
MGGTTGTFRRRFITSRTTCDFVDVRFEIIHAKFQQDDAQIPAEQITFMRKILDEGCEELRTEQGNELEEAHSLRVPVTGRR